MVSLVALPASVTEPLNELGGQFLWLINALTVVAFIGLAVGQTPTPRRRRAMAVRRGKQA